MNVEEETIKWVKKLGFKVTEPIDDTKAEWAFVDHDEKRVLIAAWEDFQFPAGILIYDSTWHKAHWHAAVKEYLDLVSVERYKLNIFFTIATDPMSRNKSMRIITPVMIPCTLEIRCSSSKTRCYARPIEEARK